MSNQYQSTQTTTSLDSLSYVEGDQNVQGSNMDLYDLDLLLPPHNMQHDTSLQLPDFSFGASAAEVSGLVEGCPPGTSDPNLAWDPSPASHPPVNTPDHLALQLLTYHIQSLDTQIRSLDARIQKIEALYQQACSMMDDFTTWSRKMEKHCQNTNNKVLELSEIVRTIIGDGETANGPAKQA
ncbi:hypothetical protein F4802DRAFT_611323 [Xylaria palmicola]|nr:hypothetical protein F4802DRAFT_611323 [Xylaria palmicola]